MVRCLLCWLAASTICLGACNASSDVPQAWEAQAWEAYAPPHDMLQRSGKRNHPIDDAVSPSPLGATLAYGIDTSIAPCDDFYEYANGGWRKSVVFPAAWKPQQRIWSHIHQSMITTHAKIVKIIDSAYRSVGTTDNAAFRAVGVFYASCLAADSLERVLPRRGKKDSTAKDSLRSEQCVQRVLQYLGDASGQIFVEQFVAKGIVDKMDLLLKAIKSAAHNRILQHAFMNASEIADMQNRLDKLYLRVGIPDKTIDFSGLVLSPSHYHQNKNLIANFNNKQRVNEIGGDSREQWKMSALTINATYNPVEHAIEVPIAMFLPPFFYPDGDDALNYSSVGYVIGHEMFHGLSSTLNHIENTAVKTAIEQFVTTFTTLGTVDGWSVHGKRTYKEDIADLGGIRTAYDAWKTRHLANSPTTSQVIDGFTPEQRFFLSFGQVWRAKWASQAANNNDVHSAYFARVNGMVRQMPEFAAAFGCQAGDRMVLPPDSVSRLW